MRNLFLLISILALVPFSSRAEIQDEQRFLYGFVGDNVMHGVLLGVKVETMTADSTVIFSMATQSNANVGGIQSGWYSPINEPGTYSAFLTGRVSDERDYCDHR